MQDWLHERFLPCADDSTYWKKKKSVAGSAGKTSPNCLLDATKCISRYFLSIEPDSGDFEDTEENESAEAMDEGETEEA